MKRWLGLIVFAAACGGGGGGGGDNPDGAPPAPDARVVDAGPPDAIFDHGTTTFTATKQGDPAWETTGWTLYTAPDTIQTVQQVFSQHAYNSTQNAFHPGTVHAPPYDTEVADRVATLGFPTGDNFLMSEWTYPQGVMANAVIIPSANAPTGVTADYASGPYIPKALALYVDADMYKDSTVVDPDFDAPYPTLATLEPNTTADGWSHMTLSFGEDTSFIPGTPGHYHLHVHAYEINTPANGWTIDIPFDVH
jgi:hypothetical protein